MAEIKKIKVDGVEYDIASGLYTQYLKFTITGDDNIESNYQISVDTFKPITTVEEFRDYIRNRLIYSDSPTFTVTHLRFMLLNNTIPSYLAFSCAYYGTPSCGISEIDSDNNVTTIISSTNISVVTGRITNFEVLATIKG